jgi:hypothetical protein
MLKHLWKALDFRLSEILRLDFWFGLAAGGGSAALAVVTPSAILRCVGITSGLVGVVIGAVLAGIAVQAAFMDQEFLRQIRAIGKNPVRYLSPLIFTAVTGIFSMLGLIALSALSVKSEIILLGILSGVTGFFTVWTVVSLLYCLSTLVQFTGLKMDALGDDSGEP